jgi:hypothetical protein
MGGAVSYHSSKLAIPASLAPRYGKPSAVEGTVPADRGVGRIPSPAGVPAVVVCACGAQVPAGKAAATKKRHVDRRRGTRLRAVQRAKATVSELTRGGLWRGTREQRASNSATARRREKACIYTEPLLQFAPSRRQEGSIYGGLTDPGPLDHVLCTRDRGGCNFLRPAGTGGGALQRAPVVWRLLKS